MGAVKQLLSSWFFWLLLVAAVLLWHIGSLAFMQDELSALSRVGYGSFSELIREGVIIDYHPAFVQVFLHYWTHLFGQDQWIVKLPSMLLALATIRMFYSIARRYLGEGVALMGTTILCLSQYYVVYFTLARPYAFGAFFIVLQLFSLLQWSERKGYSRWALLFVVGALGAALSHHFAALSAAVIACWGLFLLKGSQRKAFVLMCVLAFLLYLPHMSVTLEQLSRGGVGGPDGWLGAPKPEVWVDYFRYVAQYMGVTMAIGLISIILSLKRISQLPRTAKMLVLLGFGMHLIMMAIGYFYSIYVNPIFQYSILLFSSIPFLLAVFSAWRLSALHLKGALLGALILSTLYGFFFNRQHLEVMSRQPLNEMALYIKSFNQRDVKPLALFSMNEKYLGVYSDLLEIDFDYLQVDKTSLQDLHDDTREYNGKLISCLLAQPEFALMYRDLISPRAQRVPFPTFEILLDDGAQSVSERGLILDSTWVNVTDRAIQEWGPVYQLEWVSTQKVSHVSVSVIHVSESTAESEVTLVTELSQGERKLGWYGRDKALYSVTTDSLVHHYMTFDLNLDTLDYSPSAPLTISCYVWNRGGTPISEQSLRAHIEEQRIIRGALTEEIPKDYTRQFSSE